MDIKTKVLGFISELVNPYPQCKGCNREERMLNVGRIMFLLGLIMVGQTLIYQVEGDIESQCCKEMKRCVEFVNEFTGGDVAFVQGKDLFNEEDEIGFGVVRGGNYSFND